ncbi:leucyl aminopeptidase [Natronocella acetinitrilica]|uniref:Probable cytosol aminopeptidase n=1 Tax=Natronocella acetinitrilica TaxID=414046 RepID=A0AAE3G6Z8_9GAMM|nr:leucyl aminopeptidase [Natronocella acetinitrilica]MCP1674997.1 leucyl aminopeptidase [Natronocella acetinitrilica]
MEFAVKHVNPIKQRTGCLIVGVTEKRRLDAVATAVDEAADGYLSRLLRQGDMDGRIGQTLLLPAVPGIAADRVLLVGLGRERDLTERAYDKAVQAMLQTLSNCGAKDALCCLADARVKGRDQAWIIRDTAQSVIHSRYRFDACKSEKDNTPPALKKMIFHVGAKADVASGEAAADIGKAIGEGMNLARELGNLPGNICTPSYLAGQAKALQEAYPAIELDVLDEASMEELGMGALLSVSRGSEQEARLIVMHYRGASDDEPPHVLVGKGITFDTGGISLKPGAAMDEMKFDMCGAASAFGAMQAAVALKLPINLVVIIAAAENMPDGRATKPGDVVTSMSGQTIEILNTDAEGRLVLCDALTYAERYKPASVVNMATLTGACIIALGHHVHGLMSNNTGLADQLLAAGKSADDRAWQLPLGEEWDEQLKSNFADMQNIGGRSAGTITAGCFLARFTKKYRWAHLDIAGTAWNSGDKKGATGRPVPLLTQYLIDRAG